VLPVIKRLMRNLVKDSVPFMWTVNHHQQQQNFRRMWTPSHHKQQYHWVSL